MTAEGSIETLKTSHFSEPFKTLDDAQSTGLTGWTDLIMSGYGFTDGTNNPETEFEIEYTKEGSQIIALHINNIVIASLVVKESKTHFPNFTSLHIHGIVIKLEFQGKGIGTLLYKEALKIPNISIIAGSTKTPSSVIARAKGLTSGNYRTFYGLHEVTSPDKNGYSQAHKTFLNQYLINKENVQPNQPIVFRDTQILLPNIPSVKSFPLYIQEAFLPIILKQQEIGDIKTAVMPLLSIKQELLNT